MLHATVDQLRRLISSVGHPRPDIPVVAIGDIHGRMDLLEKLVPRLDRDAHWVFVGDLVDRGPQSKAVLEYVSHLQCDTPDRVTCLKGNHERMLLDFLDVPGDMGRRWLKHGGTETVRSFGMSILPTASPTELALSARRLKNFLRPTLLQWLRDLPLMWRSGNLMVVHAAADPQKSMNQQEEQTLLWGHPQFLRRARKDGFWVVHGHTVVAEPVVARSRISVDTGALLYRSLDSCTH